MTLFFGDSITAGKPGASYVDYTITSEGKKNFGLGGDTVYGLQERIKKLKFPRKNCNVVLEIGTNDILLPFLQKYSLSWYKVVNNIYRRGSKPIIEEDDFRDAYKTILGFFMECRMICISIPCIGENYNSSLNNKVNDYNLVIKDLCSKNKAKYVDFNQWQKEQIRTKYNETPYFISKCYSNVMLDTLTTTYLGLSNAISEKRFLVVTVDGVHLNKKSAYQLGKMISIEVDNTFDR